MAVRRPAKRGFGSIRLLPSKRFQARYTGPDTATHTAPTTFETRMDAEAWLTDRRREITAGTWTVAGPATATYVTLAPYAEAWLTGRAALKPRTRAHYRQLLDRRILPTLGTVAVKAITPDKVRVWHAGMGTATPTLTAHAYSLLRSILLEAVADGLIPSSPCHIRGAGSSKRVHKIKPATLPELAELAAAMPERHRVLTLLAAWCGLRFGELTELRRSDLDMKNGVIHVRRGVVRVNGEHIVGSPKSAAGHRDVTIPPHLLPAIREHLTARVNGRDGLLFPAADGVSHLSPTTLYAGFHRARDIAGRPDLRWHDLRHTGAVLAASTGATLAELMARLGHSTAGAAMKYQHASQNRDAIIAAKLSELVGR